MRIREARKREKEDRELSIRDRHLLSYIEILVHACDPKSSAVKPLAQAEELLTVAEALELTDERIQSDLEIVATASRLQDEMDALTKRLANRAMGRENPCFFAADPQERIAGIGKELRIWAKRRPEFFDAAANPPRLLGR